MASVNANARWFESRWRRCVALLAALLAMTAILLDAAVRQSRRQQATMRAIAASGGWVLLDHECDDDGFPLIDHESDSEAGEWRVVRAESSSPQWLRCVTNDQTLFSVAKSARVENDAGIKAATTLPQIECLFLSGSKRISREGFRDLGRMRQLRHLDLNLTSLTHADVARLENLRRLESLHLGMTQLNDADLAHIAKLTNLQTLVLAGNAITDAGLVHLKSLRKLRHLDLAYTQVTDAGVVQLRELPNLACLRLDGISNSDDTLTRL